MSSRIQNKEIKIIVIEQSGAVRQLLTESIRNYGYENVQGVATIKDALSTIEVEPVTGLFLHYLVVSRTMHSTY